MVMNYLLDDTGELSKYVQNIIKRTKDFRLLEHVRFLYVFKLEEPEFDREKRMLEASIRRLPNRERDLYEKDVELRVYQQVWNEKTHKQKYQTIFHELLHVSVRVNEAMQPEIDDDGRIRIDIVSHDLVFTGFKREIEVFGLPPDSKALIASFKTLSVRREQESVS